MPPRVWVISAPGVFTIFSCAWYIITMPGFTRWLTTARAAMAHAAWSGRTTVVAEDIRAAARLALPHRRRRNPFDPPRLSDEQLDKALSVREQLPQLRKIVVFDMEGLRSLDDPDIIATFGPTMPIMVKSGSADPLFDSSATECALGYVPTSIEQGFPVTIDWLGRNGFL